MFDDLGAALNQMFGGYGIVLNPQDLANVPQPKRREPEKPTWDNPTPLPNHVRAVRLDPRLLAVHMASARHPRDGMEWS